MYHKEVVERKVIMNPEEIRRSAIDGDIDKSLLIDNIIKRRLIDLYGDRCIDIGFVEGSSIEILDRSIGKIYAEHLNGNIVYDVRFTANVCNPVKGELVTGRVTNSNKMGLLVKSGPLNIVLARQHHINRKCFRKISVGDEIPISVVGSRFTYNDREISVIGYLGDVSDYIDEDDIEDDDIATEITEDDTTEVTDDTESAASEMF